MGWYACWHSGSLVLGYPTESQSILGEVFSSGAHLGLVWCVQGVPMGFLTTDGDRQEAFGVSPAATATIVEMVSTLVLEEPPPLSRHVQCNGIQHRCQAFAAGVVVLRRGARCPPRHWKRQMA